VPSAGGVHTHIPYVWNS